MINYLFVNHGFLPITNSILLRLHRESETSPENCPLVFYDDSGRSQLDKLNFLQKTLNADVGDANKGGKKYSREISEGVEPEPLGLAKAFKVSVGVWTGWG